MNFGFRSKSLAVCMIIVCAFVYSDDLSANSFYVATNGNDSNSGDTNAPFRTIQSGLSHLNAGDTLIIRGGTYAESIPYFTIPSGIDASRQTTVQGAPGETVILNGVGPNFDVIEIANRSYITLDNLTVEGAPNTGIRLGEGAGWEVSYITVKNVIAKNNGTGIYTSGIAGLNHHLLLQHVTVARAKGMAFTLQAPIASLKSLTLMRASVTAFTYTAQTCLMPLQETSFERIEFTEMVPSASCFPLDGTISHTTI